ncbi:murein transglycosylase A [Aureimonas pseudogalii]|uniref:peptidoglycan lytic exotransglycosylase n=1 Tax=Aureimonas pseudogalii TaxID=1744844 RepID=A0A7W6EA70_9HYPH|nr:MltA domain-containing protein [Aureimonas pseudogalii]MBB3997568.1 membrane-bound lytic murein transglycosylase A [Aureimonas pseudogalii]
MPPTDPFPAVTPLRFAELEGWPTLDVVPALAAFRRSAVASTTASPNGATVLAAPETRAPAAGGVSAALLDAAFQALVATPDPVSQTQARRFFEQAFEPVRVETPGFVTGYYEPLVAGSRERTDAFTVPLYVPPSDLVTVPPESEGAPGRFVQSLPDGSTRDYPDRATIEAGALAGRGLEIAWLADPIDAFFVHVQGSARLALPDGTTMRVGYAAKNGHRFTAIGRVLVQEGRLALEEADMAGLRRWLAAHPAEMRRVLDQNRSFIFFREMPDDEPEAGPIGGAGVALTPLASLAVDRLLHAYGTPILVEAPTLVVEGAPFRRLMVAQDTGSAIVGPARGDIFTGSGASAGALAGGIRHPARFTLLRPRENSVERADR